MLKKKQHPHEIRLERAPEDHRPRVPGPGHVVSFDRQDVDTQQLCMEMGDEDMDEVFNSSVVSLMFFTG